MTKYSFSDLNRWAESEGGKCTSKEFLGLDVPHSWLCSKGHAFDMKPVFVRQGGWCPKCSQIKKSEKGLQLMREYAQKHGGQCLSEAYVNSYTPLTWACKNNHTFKATRSVIKQRKNFCKQCAEEHIKAKNLEKVKVIARKKGGKCLSERFVSEYAQMKFQCAKGHVWETSWRSIRFDGSWCVHCMPNRRITIPIVQKRAAEKGWECLSKKVNGKYDPLVWKCDQGHVFKMTFGIFCRDTGCPECKKLSRQEASLKLMQKWAEARGGKCISTQYIDNEQLLLWECKNGHQFSYSRDHVKQKDKESWCEECNKMRRRQERLEEVADYARKQGGACLSTEYIDLDTPLAFRCENGHTWETTPHNMFYSETWCPKCKPNAKLDIKAMRAMAAARKGKCLSKKYVNVSTKLKWQCEEGHVWESKPSNIRSGTWCPECGRIYRGKKK